MMVTVASIVIIGGDSCIDCYYKISFQDNSTYRTSPEPTTLLTEHNSREISYYILIQWILWKNYLNQNLQNKLYFRPRTPTRRAINLKMSQVLGKVVFVCVVLKQRDPN